MSMPSSNIESRLKLMESFYTLGKENLKEHSNKDAIRCFEFALGIFLSVTINPEKLNVSQINACSAVVKNAVSYLLDLNYNKTTLNDAITKVETAQNLHALAPDFEITGIKERLSKSQKTQTNSSSSGASLDSESSASATPAPVPTKQEDIKSIFTFSKT